MFTLNQLTTFNKGQLREACREKGIGYTSLNNDGMRAALAEHASDYVALMADGTPVDPAQKLPEQVAPAVLPLVLLPLAEVLPPTLEDKVVAAIVSSTSEFGPESVPAGKPPKAPKVPKVPQVEQHGVKRPKAGTICAQIWDWCDASDAAGVRPEAKALRAALPGLDDTTKTVQFYRWRKFNNISGR